MTMTDALEGGLAISHKTIILLACHPAIPRSAVSLKSRELWPWVFIASLVMTAKAKEQPRPSSVGEGAIWYLQTIEYI